MSKFKLVRKIRISPLLIEDLKGTIMSAGNVKKEKEKKLNKQADRFEKPRTP